MGLCCSREFTFGPIWIAEELDDEDEMLKLLLMGTGNAGKTTIQKQFKLKYGNGFSDEERLQSVNVIRNGFVSAMHKLLYAVDDLLASDDIDLPRDVPVTYPDDIKPLVAVVKALPDGVELNDVVTIDLSPGPSGSKPAHKVNHSDSSEDDQKSNNSSKEVVAHSGAGNIKTMLLKDILVKLWKNPLVQCAYSHANLISSLEEPVQYMVQNIERIAAPGYIPTDLDILNVRTPTEEIEIFDFQFQMKSKEETPCRIIDVGGQRYFRRRWISEFEDLHAVVYVVGLDGFDQVLVEDGKTNRISESLELFRDLCSSPFLTNVSFILVLNKLDVFKRKWRKLGKLYEHDRNARALKSFFSMGSNITPAHHYREAIAYISQRFIAVHSQELEKAARERPSVATMGEFERPRVYPFVTCATDIDTMGKFVYQSMKTILTLKNLANNF